MVEEILVKEALAAQEIASGEELLRRLDGARLTVVAAYWIYTGDTGFWRLDLVSPEVDREGPLRVYRTIHRLAVEPTRLPGLQLNVVNVL